MTQEMKPLKCCKGCIGLDENGTFKNKFKCRFCDDYYREILMKVYNENKSDKGCDTCKNCEHVRNYSHTAGEEYECTVGLQCDTVYFEVKNCPKWIGQFESENKE